MAVWGTPVATEDDAERAVRAALDLVAAVTSLGDEVGAPGLRARAGVLTGEAAVTIGAERRGHGRRRPRQHGVARPVGGGARHGLRRRVDAARDRADDRVRGGRRVRAEGQGGPDAALAGAARRLGRARRRSSRPASRRRSSAATASCAGSRISSTPRRTRAARTSSRSPGSPGSASRGSRGSSTSTSTGCRSSRTGIAAAASPTATGVAYWALADMVRMRCRIAEDEDQAAARAKLREALEEHLADESERAFVEPRLAQLLGLAEAESPRPAGPVRRLAALLRAARRGLPDGARLRGHAVGRREPARLRRAPARLVAQPSRST